MYRKIQTAIHTTSWRIRPTMCSCRFRSNTLRDRCVCVGGGGVCSPAGRVLMYPPRSLEASLSDLCLCRINHPSDYDARVLPHALPQSNTTHLSSRYVADVGDFWMIGSQVTTRSRKLLEVLLYAYTNAAPVLRSRGSLHLSVFVHTTLSGP